MINYKMQKKLKKSLFLSVFLYCAWTTAHAAAIEGNQIDPENRLHLNEHAEAVEDDLLEREDFFYPRENIDPILDRIHMGDEGFEDEDEIVDISEQSMKDEEADHQLKHHLGLSIDGGGMRGIIPAIWLGQLEQGIHDRFGGRPKLHRIFSHIGGTSVGGILALGLANEMEAGGFINMFKDRGEDIFPTPGLSQRILNPFGLRAPLYDSAPLEKLMQNTFGERRLEQLKTRVLVTTCTEIGRPKLLDNDSRDNDGSYEIWRAARSTSAAPTYFKSYRLGNDLLNDGGLWVNNPSSLVLTRMTRDFPGLKANQFGVLSLGTGQWCNATLSRKTGKIKAVAPLLEILMTCNNAAVDFEMEDRIGENYHRINVRLRESVPLDTIQPRMIREMIEIAEGQKRLVEKFVRYNHNTIRRILNED